MTAYMNGRSKTESEFPIGLAGYVISSKKILDCVQKDL